MSENLLSPYLMTHLLTINAKEQGFEYVLLDADIRMELSEALSFDALLPIIVFHSIPVVLEAGFTDKQFPFQIIDDEEGLLNKRVILLDASPAIITGGLYFLLDSLQHFMDLSRGEASIHITSTTVLMGA